MIKTIYFNSEEQFRRYYNYRLPFRVTTSDGDSVLEPTNGFRVFSWEGSRSLRTSDLSSFDGIWFVKYCNVSDEMLDWLRLKWPNLLYFYIAQTAPESLKWA